MYYAYQKIRKHIESRKNTQQNSSSPDDALGSTTLPKMDEEEGGTGEPGTETKSLDAGIPTNPDNRRSKKRSWYALLITGFALAIDFTMAMMSIQTFYYVLEGPDRLYGLTFGSYDLTALVFAPVLGFISDKMSIFKLLFLACFAFNAAGNLVYSFAYLAGQWWMMLLARLLAGVGASALGLGSSYLAKTTTLDQRQTRLVSYRVTQSVARMMGPFVGYIFLELPAVSDASSTALKVFNWYTIPGWAAFFVVIIVTVFFYFMFIDPTEENEHYVHCEVHNEENLNSPTRAKEFRTFALIWLCMQFVTTFLQFGFYSNLFALFAGQYHEIRDQYDQWKVFIGVGSGAVFSSMMYRTGVRTLPHIFDERIISIVSSWLLVVVYLLVIPYDGSTTIPPEATFYAATVLFGIATVLVSPALESVFSKKITQYQDVVGDNIAKLLGIFYMFQSAGRFAGPLVVGAVTFIATPSGQVNYCQYGETIDSAGNPICSGDTSQSCAIFPDQYYVDGCVLKHAIPVYAVWSGVAGILSILYMIIIKRHWSYS
jgi:MFS family permease